MNGMLYERVITLAEALAALADSPPRSKEEHAAYDAWRAILKPRASRMIRRAEHVADPGAWEFDEEREPERLRSAAWVPVVREFAALYTELAGARAQYERVQIRWTPKTRFGFQRLPGRAPVGGSAKDRARRRADEKKALNAARKAKVAAAKKLLDGAVKRVAAARELLDVLLQETRHVVADLQRAEEARLAAQVVRLAEGTRERERAEDLLLTLARGRLRATRYREQRAAGWGSLLRTGWLTPRNRLVRLLEGL